MFRRKRSLKLILGASFLIFVAGIALARFANSLPRPEGRMAWSNPISFPFLPVYLNGGMAKMHAIVHEGIPYISAPELAQFLGKPYQFDGTKVVMNDLRPTYQGQPSQSPQATLIPAKTPPVSAAPDKITVEYDYVSYPLPWAAKPGKPATVDADQNGLVSLLNEKGEQGWEVIAAFSTMNWQDQKTPSIYFMLRRPESWYGNKAVPDKTPYSYQSYIYDAAGAYDANTQNELNAVNSNGWEPAATFSVNSDKSSVKDYGAGNLTYFILKKKSQ